MYQGYILAKTINAGDSSESWSFRPRFDRKRPRDKGRIQRLTSVALDFPTLRTDTAGWERRKTRASREVPRIGREESKTVSEFVLKFGGRNWYSVSFFLGGQLLFLELVPFFFSGVVPFRVGTFCLLGFFSQSKGTPHSSLGGPVKKDTQTHTHTHPMVLQGPTGINPKLRGQGFGAPLSEVGSSYALSVFGGSGCHNSKPCWFSHSLKRIAPSTFISIK